MSVNRFQDPPVEPKASPTFEHGLTLLGVYLTVFQIVCFKDNNATILNISELWLSRITSSVNVTIIQPF